MSGVCQRCGKQDDPDLRTLFMASMYKMEELGLPFKVDELDSLNRKFYTLRVCKDCRGDWLLAIQQWFHSTERTNF